MIRPRLLTGFALAGALLCWLAAAPSAAPLHPTSGPLTPTMQPPPPPPPAPSPASRPAPPPPPPPVASAGQPVNVQIEITIREEGGAATAVSKAVTLIAADQQGTSIRSNSLGTDRTLQINVDAKPHILPDGKLRVDLGLEYEVAIASGTETPVWRLNQRMSLVLQSGKPLVVSKTTDPRSDRQAVVEVTATILK